MLKKLFILSALPLYAFAVSAADKKEKFQQ